MNYKKKREVGEEKLGYWRFCSFNAYQHSAYRTALGEWRFVSLIIRVLCRAGTADGQKVLVVGQTCTEIRRPKGVFKPGSCAKAWAEKLPKTVQLPVAIRMRVKTILLPFPRCATARQGLGHCYEGLLGQLS